MLIDIRLSPAVLFLISFVDGMPSWWWLFVMIRMIRLFAGLEGWRLYNLR
jgi:hypothetical protein